MDICKMHCSMLQLQLAGYYELSPHTKNLLSLIRLELSRVLVRSTVKVPFQHVISTVIVLCCSLINQSGYLESLDLKAIIAMIPSCSCWRRAFKWRTSDTMRVDRVVLIRSTVPVPSRLSDKHNVPSFRVGVDYLKLHLSQV
eukprot:scaffold22583_cov106-Cylindrotheca_fusiformis.AAC.9